jgi:amidase
MASFAEYGRFDGLGLAELVRRGEVQPRELVEAALEVIDAVNPAINAVIHRMDGRALEAAARVSRDARFAGVPFLLKDLVQLVRGEPYRAGSRFLGDFRPDHDSELTRRFREAGLVFIGKTNTPEFGLTPFTEPERFGPTRNPWDPSRTAGGSSGGSAAAVAAGMVPLASGGDGGGSIRIPASCCGVFGLKPTRGRTPAGPDVGQLWHGAVVEHVITRSVRDSAAMLDATAGPDPGAPYFPPPPSRPFLTEVTTAPGRLVIARATRPFLGGTVHPECERAVDHAGDLLRGLGHDVVDAAPPVDGPAFARAFLTMVCAELNADIRDAEAALSRSATRAGFEVTTWALALLGRALRADELSVALRFLERQARGIGAFFSEYDLLLTPALAEPPFPTGALQPKPRDRLMLEIAGRLGSGRLLRTIGLLDEMAAQVFQAVPYTAVFNVTGQPAMSVPLAWTGAGLPIGVHLVGRYADEATLFRVAGQLERERPWSGRYPAMGSSQAPSPEPQALDSALGGGSGHG